MLVALMRVRLLYNPHFFHFNLLLFSSSFKLFLELEPQVRDIIFKFYESKYASCLKMLDEMKVSLTLTICNWCWIFIYFYVILVGIL